jgi:hypothetical protein
MLRALPTVSLRAEDKDSEQALVVVYDAVKSLGFDWDVEGGEPPRYASLQDAVWAVSVVIAWDVVRRELTQRLIDALERKVVEMWKQHHLRIEIVVETKDGQRIHRVKSPWRSRLWPR